MKKDPVVNTVYSDFRKEVVAAGLVAAGYDADRIFITRRDASISNTGKEIAGIRFAEGGRKTPDVFISTNRPGIYDSLPEGLFHTSLTRGKRSKEAILKEIRVHREEEFYIRRFFSLYETELERMQVDIQSVELSYDRPYRDRAFVATLQPFWPVIGRMDLDSAIIFVRHIPFIHKIRDSLRNVEKAMAMILGDKVSIELVRDICEPRISFKKLGKATLGVDMLLKGKYRGAEPAVRVTVIPGQRRHAEYVPGSRLWEIACSLKDIFLPARFSSTLVVISQDGDRHFRIGNKGCPCILGMNSSLQSRYES